MKFKPRQRVRFRADDINLAGTGRIVGYFAAEKHPYYIVMDGKSWRIPGQAICVDESEMEPVE